MIILTRLWECTYCDELKALINQITSEKQRTYFLKVFDRMGEYVTEHDDDFDMTFGEYFERFEQ